MKRYDHFCSYDGGGPAEEVESPDGGFVRYDNAVTEIERLRTALTWIATVNAMDHEYQAMARDVLRKA